MDVLLSLKSEGVSHMLSWKAKVQTTGLSDSSPRKLLQSVLLVWIKQWQQQRGSRSLLIEEVLGPSKKMAFVC